MSDRQSEGGGHGGVDRAAALLQNLGTHLTRREVLGHHHSLLGPHRLAHGQGEIGRRQRQNQDDGGLESHEAVPPEQARLPSLGGGRLQGPEVIWCRFSPLSSLPPSRPLPRWGPRPTRCVSTTSTPVRPPKSASAW